MILLILLFIILSLIVLFIYSACVVASRADEYIYKESDLNDCRRIKR